MKPLLFSLALALSASAAVAQDAPDFFTKTFPQHVLGPFLQSYGAMKGEEASLDAKTQELIALAVAAQIPCQYCVHAHAKNARLAGATEEELREAVAMAGFVRHLSTALNGAAYDFNAFREEHDQIAPPPSD